MYLYLFPVIGLFDWMHPHLWYGQAWRAVWQIRRGTGETAAGLWCGWSWWSEQQTWINQYCFQTVEISPQTANLGRLNMTHHIHLRPCMYKCSVVSGCLYPQIQATVTDSQSLGFRGNLSAPVCWIRAAPLRLGIQSSWILRLEIW